MKIFRFMFLMTSLGFLSMGMAAFASQDVVAKVGSISITRYELQREMQRLLPLNSSYHRGVPKEKVAEVKEKALDSLVERAYKVNYAQAEKISAENKVADEKVKSIRDKFPNKEEFKKALGGETPEAFRASIYRDLLAQKAEEVAVSAKVKVSQEQVRAFYEENKSTYNRPRQFKASHILVKVDPASNGQEKATLKKKAEGLAEKARAGEDFYNLAYYNSDDRSKYVGGDLGVFHEGQTVPEFEQVLKTMKVGEISAPVQTRFGYHIIKLVEVNEPRLLSFDEVRDKVRQHLEKKQRESLYTKWMSGLKDRYPVQRF